MIASRHTQVLWYRFTGSEYMVPFNFLRLVFWAREQSARKSAIYSARIGLVYLIGSMTWTLTEVNQA